MQYKIYKKRDKLVSKLNPMSLQFRKEAISSEGNEKTMVS
jgi:hypothetical protein